MFNYKVVPHINAGVDLAFLENFENKLIFLAPIQKIYFFRGGASDNPGTPFDSSNNSKHF